MKGILVILDGIGDLPHKQLNGKTPLEAADTPNLDFLAARGILGEMYPVKPRFIPESDEAIVSIFGNELISSTRGQLEARGNGLDLKRGDLALRVNFGTIDEKGNIKDRRAGRTLTTEEAKTLSDSLNKIEMQHDFEFKNSVQHRGVLAFKGGFSDNFTENDLTYIQGKTKEQEKIVNCKPLDETENTHHSVNIVNEFLDKARDVLKDHPVNLERKKKGLMSANYLFVRGPGIEKPKLKKYKKWFSIAYMPLEIGFSELSGMEVFSFDYPKLKKLDVYDNLHKGLTKTCKFAIKTIKKQHKNFNYCYLHLKETDLPGHDNKPFEKKQMIEFIDKNLFNFLRKFAPPNNINVVVTADHSTPCKLKNHSADPVPVLFYNKGIPKAKKFCEKQAKTGELGKFNGNDLFKKVGFK